MIKISPMIADGEIGEYFLLAKIAICSSLHIKQTYASIACVSARVNFIWANIPFPYISMNNSSTLEGTRCEPPYQMSQYNKYQQKLQSFLHLVQVVTSSENDCTLSKTQYFTAKIVCSTTKRKSSHS